MKEDLYTRYNRALAHMNARRYAQRYDDEVRAKSIIMDEHYGSFTGPIYISKVIFNKPATIIYWSDGVKTVVKVHNEKFDKEKGLFAAISKRFLGNQGNYYNEIKKWINDDENTNLLETLNSSVDAWSSSTNAVRGININIIGRKSYGD